MDSRSILLWLHIFVVVITITTTIAHAGKNKKQGLKPHVSHVVVDGTNPKPLKRDVILNTLTNTVSNEKVFGLYSKRRLKASRRLMTVKKLRRLIHKKKSILNERKRRRVLKRLRLELATLKYILRFSRKRCKTSEDCGRNECCLKFNQKGYGRCKNRPKMRQKCKPALLPGIDTECPCRYGLTCSPFKKSKRGYIKFRCDALMPVDEEIEAHSITGLGRYK